MTIVFEPVTPWLPEYHYARVRLHPPSTTMDLGPKFSQEVCAEEVDKNYSSFPTDKCPEILTMLRDKYEEQLTVDRFSFDDLAALVAVTTEGDKVVAKIKPDEFEKRFKTSIRLAIAANLVAELQKAHSPAQIEALRKLCRQHKKQVVALLEDSNDGLATRIVVRGLLGASPTPEKIIQPVPVRR